MPKLTITFTKKNQADPFISITPTLAPLYFTQAEIDTVITPYLAFAKSLPGLQGDTVTISSDSIIVERTYDTMEHLKFSESLLAISSGIPVVVAKCRLVDERRAVHNVSGYNAKHTITP